MRETVKKIARTRGVRVPKSALYVVLPNRRRVAGHKTKVGTFSGPGGRSNSLVRSQSRRAVRQTTRSSHFGNDDLIGNRAMGNHHRSVRTNELGSSGSASNSQPLERGSLKLAKGCVRGSWGDIGGERSEILVIGWGQPQCG